MLKYIAIAAAFFTAFAAGGYLVGKGVVTSETYMLAMLANSASITLIDKSASIDLRDGPDKSPFWTLKLANNSSYFANPKYALQSLEGKSISAQSNLLLTILSGGAATATASTVYKQVLESQKSKDWRTFAAIVVGSVTGYMVGYYTAIHVAKPSQAEALALLRKPDSIEKLKKYIFLSMADRRGMPNFDKLQIDNTYQSPECKIDKNPNVQASEKELECIVGGVIDKPSMQQKILYSRLVKGLHEALADDSKNLSNDAFLVFFIGSHQI